MYKIKQWRRWEAMAISGEYVAPICEELVGEFPRETWKQLTLSFTAQFSSHINEEVYILLRRLFISRTRVPTDFNFAAFVQLSMQEELSNVIAMEWPMFLMAGVVILVPNFIRLQYWLPGVGLTVRPSARPVAGAGVGLSCGRCGRGLALWQEPSYMSAFEFGGLAAILMVVDFIVMVHAAAVVLPCYALAATVGSHCLESIQKEAMHSSSNPAKMQAAYMPHEISTETPLRQITTIMGMKLVIVTMQMARYTWYRENNDADNSVAATNDGAPLSAESEAEAETDDGTMPSGGPKLQVRLSTICGATGNSDDNVLDPDYVLDARDLFWFRKPRIMLLVFQYTLFENSLSMAAILFTLWQVRPSARPVAGAAILFTLWQFEEHHDAQTSLSMLLGGYHKQRLIEAQENGDSITSPEEGDEPRADCDTANQRALEMDLAGDDDSSGGRPSLDEDPRKRAASMPMLVTMNSVYRMEECDEGEASPLGAAEDMSSDTKPPVKEPGSRQRERRGSLPTTTLSHQEEEDDKEEEKRKRRFSLEAQSPRRSITDIFELPVATPPQPRSMSVA
eukprot:gene9325-11050_t